MNFFKKHWLKFGLLLLLLFVGYQVRKIQAQKNQPKNPITAPINPKTERFEQVKMRDITQGLVLTGKVQSESYAKLQFQTGGQLAWVGVKLGDRVKKGQAIASLDKRQLRKQLEKELNDYMTNRWNFEDTQDKYKETRDRLLITTDLQRILDRTQFSLNNAVLDVELTDLTLKYATIYSPVEGIVVELTQPASGVNILAGAQIATIVNPDSLYFRTEVDEEDVTKLSLGQPAILTIDAYKDQNLDSTVKYISFDSLQNQAATVYEVRFAINDPNSTLKYRLGMNGNAQVVESSKNQVLSLPIEAVYEEGASKFVYKLAPDLKTKLKTPVTTGLSSQDYIEITSGLSLLDQVVVND